MVPDEAIRGVENAGRNHASAPIGGAPDRPRKGASSAVRSPDQRPSRSRIGLNATACASRLRTGRTAGSALLSSTPSRSLGLLFARVAIGVTVFVFLAVVAFTVAFVDDRRGNGGALSAATATPIPNATGDPRVLTQSGTEPGYKRIASPLGGWSMELPAAWTARPARVRGAEIASFDMSSAQLSGNAPNFA